MIDVFAKERFLWEMMREAVDKVVKDVVRYGYAHLPLQIAGPFARGFEKRDGRLNAIIMATPTFAQARVTHISRSFGLLTKQRRIVGVAEFIEKALKEGIS